MTRVLVNDLLVATEPLAKEKKLQIYGYVESQGSDVFAVRDAGMKAWKQLYSTLSVDDRPKARQHVREKHAAMMGPGVPIGGLEFDRRVQRMLEVEEFKVNGTDVRPLYRRVLFFAYYFNGTAKRYLSVVAPLITTEFEVPSLKPPYEEQIGKIKDSLKRD